MTGPEVDLESSCLGSILIDGSLLPAVADLEPRDLSPAGGTILSTMRALHDAGDPVDLVTVSEALERDGRLAAVGGAARLAGLVDAVPDVEAVGAYGRLLRGRAVRRRAAEGARRAAEALAGSGDAEAAAGLLEGALVSLRRTAGPTENDPRLAAVVDPGELGRKIAVREETLVQLPLPVLNAAAGRGVGGTDLVVLVGPPRSGKTTLALVCGLAIAEATGRRAYFLAPDQGIVALYRWLRRYYAAEADPDETIRRHAVLVDETDDRTNLESFVSLVRARRDDVGVVVLDSAQTILTPGAKDEGARVAATMAAAKTIADDLVVPVLVASQANRASWRSARTEDRADPLGSGMHSSAIEFRATVLAFIEKVSRGAEPPTFRIAVRKSAHGRDDLEARIVLDPATVTFTEAAAPASEDERAEEERRAWADLAGDATRLLAERWTAGEQPGVRDFAARLRAMRQAAGRKGPSTDRALDLVAYLERVGTVVVNPGPNRARLLCRPTTTPDEVPE